MYNERHVLMCLFLSLQLTITKILFTSYATYSEYVLNLATVPCKFKCKIKSKCLNSIERWKERRRLRKIHRNSCDNNSVKLMCYIWSDLLVYTFLKMTELAKNTHRERKISHVFVKWNSWKWNGDFFALLLRSWWKTAWFTWLKNLAI